MKPFDLEKAKAGKPVVTRDGRPVRIICWDRNKTDYPIVALVGDKEVISSFTTNGSFSLGEQDPKDLFMAIEKKKGWINIYKYVAGTGNRGGDVYPTKEEAIKSRGILSSDYITTIQVEWEE